MFRGLSLVLMSSCFVLSLSAQDWSVWKPDPVFHGIEVRARCEGVNEFAARTMWDVELRNTYQKTVDLTWAADAESERASGVRPGETVDVHPTVSNDCAAGLMVKVADVRNAAAQAAGSPSSATTLQGRWTSKDPEPLRKELVVQLSGRTVTTTFSSPSFSFQISNDIPASVTVRKEDSKQVH